MAADVLMGVRWMNAEDDDASLVSMNSASSGIPFTFPVSLL